MHRHGYILLQKRRPCLRTTPLASTIVASTRVELEEEGGVGVWVRRVLRCLFPVGACVAVSVCIRVRVR